MRFVDEEPPARLSGWVSGAHQKDTKMAVKLKSLAVDLKKEREGDWVDFPELPGLRLKVRSIESPDFKEARAALQRQMALRTGKPPSEDEMTEELGHLYAKHLLLDWEGLVNDDGSPIPFSPEVATALLSNPEYRILTGAVLTCATRVGRAQIEFVEGAAKN